MSNIKVNFIFKDKTKEFTFDKDDLIQNAISFFASSVNKNIEEFYFIHNGEKIVNFDNKKLSELSNNKDVINISVNEKNEITEKMEPNLKISEHIICPKCKCMSEININNFKISITNCNNNHSIPGIYMSDFINTQYIEESSIICHVCKKSIKELLSLNDKDKNELLICSCGITICQSCFQVHKEEKEKSESDDFKKHLSIEYKDKDYFCLEHNTMFSGFCQKCKKNICNKCERKHNKHRINMFKKISPNEIFLEKIKNMNENLIKKINKFNEELTGVIKLLNNISKNIQNDLKMFLKISNSVINDFNLTKKNYQTIQNIKVIYNNLSDSPIFKYVDSFLSEPNSKLKLNIIWEIYNKMYLESNNIFIEKEEFKLDIKEIKINKNENNKKMEKKEQKKDDNFLIIEKSEAHSSILLKYTPNQKKIKDNKIKIFGKKFYENNKNNCSISLKNKEFSLSEYYTLNKNDLKNKNEIELKLNINKPLTDISYMFHADFDEPSIYLSEISSLENLDTSQVKDISHLFSNCTLLKSIPGLSNWDISNAININNLFYHCINLTSIPDISKWKTENVENMSYIFYDCKQITSLPDISNWDTKKVTDMRGIFCNCSSLKSLPDISKWSTEQVTNMSGLFQHCSNLSKIPDISNWIVGNVINMGGMFDHCVLLQALPDISKWDTKNVTNLNYIFYFCTNLSSISDISKWDTSKVKNMKGIFCDCTSLSILPDLAKWNTANVTNMSFMFFNCKSLLSLPDLIQWDINKVEDIKDMFTNCEKLPKQVIPKKFKI